MLRFATILAHRNADDLELRGANVLLGRHLRQAERLVVVRFKVDAINFHLISALIFFSVFSVSVCLPRWISDVTWLLCAKG